MEMLWDYINQPAGITLLASVLLYVLNKIYSEKTLVAQIRGLPHCRDKVCGEGNPGWQRKQVPAPYGCGSGLCAEAHRGEARY